MDLTRRTILITIAVLAFAPAIVVCLIALVHHSQHLVQDLSFIGFITVFAVIRYRRVLRRARQRHAAVAMGGEQSSDGKSVGSQLTSHSPIA
jgi:hypothetical protein